MGNDPLLALWPQFSHIVRTYLQKGHDQSTPVVRHLSPVQQQDLLHSSATFTSPSSEQDLWNHIEHFLDFSVRTHHKFFLNQLYSTSLWPAVFGDMLASLVNTSLSTYEVSPVATLMERTLIQKMLSLVGFPQGEGLFVTGGSNANLVALLAARHHRYPQIKEKGISALEGKARPILFVSEEAHYSYLKAANALGLGTQQVWKVRSNDVGEMLIEDLKQQIVKARKEGGDPFFIGATAGTTVTGAFDPLEDLACVASEEDLWLHVDGAYGGGLLFLKDHEEGVVLKGHQLADSFAWDAHKTMGIPLICSVILFRQSKRLQASQGGEGGRDYLFHQTSSNHEWDLGPDSLQCGKRNDVLKLWLTWSYLGDEGYQKRFRQLISLAKEMENLIKQDEDFTLLIPVHFLNVCFQYRPVHQKKMNLADWNRLNLLLRQRLVETGLVMLNYSDWKGTVLLRPVFLNPNLSLNDLCHLKATIKQIGQQIFQTHF
jgi:glutamate/tyrosine decarboxylase-like PLP-dependent enzyme